MVDKENSVFKKYKIAIIFGVGATAIALVLIFAAGMPLFKNMRASSAELNAKKDELSKLNTKLENLKSLSDKEADLKAKNQKVLAALPQDKDVSRLFVQFENIAKANGINISSVSEVGAAGAVKPTGSLAQVDYTVSGTTTNYASLKATLSKIENALRVLSVSKVDVSGTGNNLSTTFIVTTYVRGTGK